MRNNLFDFLRMGRTTNTPPIRHRMRSVLLVLGLLLGSLNVWGGSIKITSDDITDYPNKAAYGTRNWTVGTIAGQAKVYGSTASHASLQFNSSNRILYNTTALPGRITSIVLTTASGTNREWKVYGGTSAATSSSTDSYGVAIGTSQEVTTKGTTYTVSSGDYTYFLCYLNASNASYIKSVVVNYEDESSPCQKLAAPTNPSSTPAQTSVVLSWDAVENASGYKVVFNGTDYDIASGTTKTIEGLAMETEYHWTVAAKGDGSTYCEAGTATAQQSVTTLDVCTSNKAVYTVASITSVTPSGALEGSTATFANTYTSNKEQMTSGKKQTLTLSGYAGATIKGLTLSMHSNGSSGAGTFSLVIGSTTVAEISNATDFEAWFDNESFGTAYRNVHVLFAEDVVVGTDEDIVVTIAATTNSLFCQSFTFCYEEPAPAAVEKPTFSVAGGSYLDAQSVEINCATEDADIYYTLDGTDPSSASTPYSGAISISETKTLKAIAIKGGDASATASATYTIVVPKSVDEIWNEITSDGPTDAYVWGYVSQADVNGNNTYYISVNGSTEGNQLEIFKGDNDGHTISKGDKVVVNGDLTIWGSTKEFASGTGKVVRYSAKGAVNAVVVSGTATKNTYSANETFETAGLVVTATYANGFSEVVTEGITWGDNLTDHKVAATGTVQVTATVGGVTSDAYGVDIVVSTKALVSIALSAVEFEVYQGLELPKPIVTATYSEGEPEVVTAWAEFTGYDKTTPGEQTITVSYSFGGGEPIVETYTVTVKPIYNVELAAGVARDLIINSVGSAGSGANEMIIRGIVVNPSNPSSSKQTYYISDNGSNTNTVEIFKGLYIDGANFTASNKLIAGDEVVVKGAVTYYKNSTPEFSEGSILQSLARTPNFKIADVTGFEVGADDLAVADLTITQDGEGEVTLASSDKEEFVTIEGGKLHAVAPGTATITANLAANGIYKAATYEFSVTVIAAQVKYAITFDDNGADGGSAPEAIANKAAGVEVTLPANTWTKEGFTFTGWKVFNNSTSAEVEVVAGAFEMPASAVTIQAQWAEIPVWAYTYTSNITVGTDKVVINTVEYAAKKTGTNSAFGSTTIEVPTGATTLHFHAAGWGADAVVNLEVKKGETLLNTFALTKDDGVKSNSPFTLKGTPYLQYYSVALSEITEPTTITFKAKDDGGKRFVLYGVNQEGGIVPVLDHITITGSATKTEYEVGDEFNPAGLGANAIYTLGGVELEPVAIDAKDIEWSFEPATIAANTTSVTVTATYEGKNDQTNVHVTVTVPEPEIIVSAASLAFNNVAKEAAVADKELTVTLKSVENATLTITGDGASAFSVTPAALTASGTVAVSASSDNVGTFNATLTIRDDAGEAEAKTVALSITVEASDDLSGTWNLVTDAAELMPGMQVIIASVADGEGDLYTLGGPNGTSANNRLAVASTATGTVLHPEAGTKVITLVDAGNGKYALQLVNGKYLYAVGGTSDNYLKERSDINNQATWTITFDEGKAIIKADVSGRNWMRKNANSAIFSCYASGQKDIVLYAKPFDYTRNVSGNYATICLPKAGKIIGATLYEIAYYGEASKKIFFDEIVNGEMEAGIPYIFQPAAGVEKINVYYSDNTAEDVVAGNRNGLIGFYDLNDENATLLLADNASLGNYILYQNAYWLVSGRAAYIANYRAYIRLADITPSEPTLAPGRRRISMSVNDTQTTTGFENAEANEAPRKVLINGELFILRGEKMYDAKGQLVK